MHILIIPSWYPSSATDLNGVFFREQALALKKHGLNVGVLNISFRLPKKISQLFNGFLGERHEIDEGVKTLRYCGFDWLRYFPRLQRKLWVWHGKRLYKRYIGKHGTPDILHAHCIFNAGLLVQQISKASNIPFVLTEHSTLYAMKKIPQDQILAAVAVANDAMRCFAVSESFCELLTNTLDSELYWQEMPNIVSQNFINESINPKKNDLFVILTVSLLTKKKAVNNLLLSFSKSFKGKKDIILKIGGDGSQRSFLEKMALDLGIENQVFFLGKLTRKQVLKEMNNANLFVLPSHFETFGVVLIESLALGVPVVATRCGGPESIVREQDGLLVPVNNVAALAEAIKSIKINYSYYNSKKIRESCVARYSEKVIATRLEEAYSEIRQISKDDICID